MNRMRLSIIFSLSGLLAIWSGIALKASFGVSAQTSGSSVVTVSAASYAATLAPEAIAAAFGVKLATGTGIAASFPLPVTLAGTTVTVNGEAAPLFFVSPNQINFLIPLGIPAGTARIVVTTGDGTVSTGSTQIALVAPALFTANADGQGPLAALLLRIKADGQASYETLAQYDGAKFITRPIQFGEESDQLFLVLYLTGIRQAAKESVRVSLGGVEYAPLFVGATDGLIGLDQINLALPRNFEGRGRITLLVKAAGAGASNSGEFSIGAVAASSDVNAPLQLTGGLEQPLLAGEEVEIRGAGFAANPRENLVQIIANDGVTAKAEVLTVTADSLRVRVPFGASTGQLRVSRNQAEASLPVRVRTSISGFVEEVRQPGNGATQRFPLSGIRVRLRNAPQIESLTNADGSYILADVTTSFNEIEINASGGNLNFPTVKFKARALADRDNQIERSTELRSIANNATATLAYTESLTAPDVVLTFLLPGRTPANLPRTHFSTSIAQLTPFGERLTPGIRLSFPNSDALPAASRPRLFKFDQQAGSPTLGEFVDIGEAVVTSDGQRVETAANAITEGSYYFVSTARPTAAVSGRVVESDGRPVPRAIVQARGQSVCRGNKFARCV